MCTCLNNDDSTSYRTLLALFIVCVFAELTTGVAGAAR